MLNITTVQKPSNIIPVNRLIFVRVSGGEKHEAVTLPQYLVPKV
jgi:hypothetical protein